MARLTPFKESALAALARGPLDLAPDGWRPVSGEPGLWNSHVVGWLAWRRYCAIEGGRAVITGAGRTEYAGIAA
jgi:hypothetical protein